MPSIIHLVLTVLMGLLIVVCLVVSWRRADNIVTLSKEPPGLSLYTVLVLAWLTGVLMLYAVLALMHSIHDLLIPGK